MRITIDVTLPPKLVEDTIVTAVESGSVGVGSWANVIVYPADVTRTVIEDDESKERYTLSRETVERGLRMAVDPETKVADSCRKAVLRALIDPDNADLDAIDADAVVQLGTLGEVVYG